MVSYLHEAVLPVPGLRLLLGLPLALLGAPPLLVLDGRVRALIKQPMNMSTEEQTNKPSNHPTNHSSNQPVQPANRTGRPPALPRGLRNAEGSYPRKLLQARVSIANVSILQRS